MKKTETYYVLGAGGHAKVVIGLLKELGISAIQVFDDDALKNGKPCNGIEIIAPTPEDLTGAFFVQGIGSNRIRKKLAENYKAADWPVLIHPGAIVDPSAKIGAGTVIMAGAIVQADAVIGNHCIINTGASVDHDCRVSDFAHIAPGCRLAGETVIGEGVLMGVGSATIPQVSVGEWSVVGAGSAVMKSLPEKTISLGVPARAIRRVK